MTPRQLAALLCALLLGHHASAQEPAVTPVADRIWVIDADGSGDFTDLQAAIVAADPGDVLLLRSDLLSDFTVRNFGKPLTLVGDGGRRRLAKGPYYGGTVLEVRDLDAGETFVLANLLIEGGGAGDLLDLERNVGTVWIQDVEIVTYHDYYWGQGSQQGIEAEACSSVVIVRTVVRPSGNGPWAAAGVIRPALGATGSAVHAFESAFTGHTQRPAFDFPAGLGGNAIDLSGSFLFASGCSITGGGGGRCSVFGGHPATAGGAGLTALDGSEVHLLDPSATGGPGGTCGTSAAPDGPATLVDGTSSLEFLPGPSRSYEIESPATAGRSTMLTARGSLGDLVLGLISDEPASVYLPLHLGTQLVSPPFLTTVDGVIPPGGVLTKEIPLPPAPLSSGFHCTFRQGLFFDVGGGAFLSSPSHSLALRPHAWRNTTGSTSLAKPSTAM